MSVERVTAQRDALYDAICSLERDLPEIDPALWSWRITRLLIESRRIVGKSKSTAAMHRAPGGHGPLGR